MQCKIQPNKEMRLIPHEMDESNSPYGVLFFTRYLYVDPIYAYSLLGVCVCVKIQLQDFNA